jgi:hypothetical protein
MLHAFIVSMRLRCIYVHCSRDHNQIQHFTLLCPTEQAAEASPLGALRLGNCWTNRDTLGTLPVDA